jgi:thiol:disulfide interchange protein DsbD
LLGLFRLPNDDKIEQVGVLRMLIAISFLGLAVYLAPAMFGLHPAGVVGDNAIAFLPNRTGHENDAPSAGGANAVPGNAPGHKDWYLDYDDAWKDAVKNDKLIFIDFTGVNCSNCRYNEKSVFPLAQVNGEMNKLVKVSLYTDTVPNPKLTRLESKEQGNRNQNWQDALAKGNATLPYYIVFRPDRKIALENGVPKGTVLGSANGAIMDVAGFVAVLKNAQMNPLAQLRRGAE